jgi:hypothetical protein
MPRRALTFSAAALLLLLVVATQASGRPARTAQSCAVNPDTSLHWEAVFSHATSTWQATLIQKSVQSRGITGTQFEKDACDDVELQVPGMDSTFQRNAFVKQASAANVDVSFEPPDILKRPDPRVVRAVFGVLPTLARANRLQLQMAHSGFREGSDIERLALHSWRVVIYNIPVDAQSGFAAEAAGAGFKVTFIPQ